MAHEPAESRYGQLWEVVLPPRFVKSLRESYDALQEAGRRPRPGLANQSFRLGRPLTEIKPRD
jgi:hypothetical protein